MGLHVRDQFNCGRQHPAKSEIELVALTGTRLGVLRPPSCCRLCVPENIYAYILVYPFVSKGAGLLCCPLTLSSVGGKSCLEQARAKEVRAHQLRTLLCRRVLRKPRDNRFATKKSILSGAGEAHCFCSNGRIGHAFLRVIAVWWIWGNVTGSPRRDKTVLRLRVLRTEKGLSVADRVAPSVCASARGSPIPAPPSHASYDNWNVEAALGAAKCKI